MAGTSVVIERSATSSGPWTQVYTGANSGSASIASQPVNVAGGGAYYRIRGITSGVVGVGGTPAQIAAPSITPGSPAASGGSGQAKITLTWSAVSSATGYNIYRWSISRQVWVLIGRNAQGTSFNDYGASLNTTHSYYITAITPEGNESIQTATVTASIT